MKSESPVATPLLSAVDVAKLLSLSQRTLWVWHRNGKLPAVVLPGGTLRWKRADVERLIREGTAA
jgi:excisionase family DNA binding protein